jgi:hypothetical protein
MIVQGMPPFVPRLFGKKVVNHEENGLGPGFSVWLCQYDFSDYRRSAPALRAQAIRNAESKRQKLPFRMAMGLTTRLQA